MILQETYELQDCIVNNLLTSNDNLFIGSETPYYTSTGLYIPQNQGHWEKMRLDILLQQGISIEYDIIEVLGTESVKIYTELVDTTDKSVNGVQQTNFTTTGNVKMVIENNQVITTFNNNSQTQSLNYTNFYWKWWTGGARGFRITNLKVKPL